MGKVAKSPAKGYYAVHVGKTKGIYFTWPECEKQVKGVIGAKFKKFETLKEAEDFVKTGPKQYTKPTPRTNTPYAATTAKTGSTIAKPASSTSSTSKATSTASSTLSQSSTHVKDSQSKAMNAIVVWTDGSSLGNGKEGCQAGMGVFFGVNDPRNLSERLDSEPQTNQRAELMAVLRAIEVCGDDAAPIEIRTDSMYTINVVTSWSENWIRNNWKRSDGAKVMNRDIIEPLLNKIKGRKGPVTFIHVKAHVGTFGNEMADKLANAGAVLPRPSSL